jgi:hypothetical protein
MKSLEQLTPEPPKLILRVGVTGHRPDKLEDMDSEILNQKLTEIFEQLKTIVQKAKDKAHDAFADHSPLLYLISPLADGADQIVADKATEEGFELQCPLPFFTQDGTNEKQQPYGKHLQDAIVFQLDGSSENSAEAYEAAGRMVLQHSDVLIAIWDMNDPRGTGGTGQIVKEALKSWIPIIWISSMKPHETKLLVPDKDEPWEKKDILWLEDNLLQTLIPPSKVEEVDSNHHAHKSDLRNEYNQEIILPFGKKFWGKFFQELLHLRLLLPQGKREEQDWKKEINDWGDKFSQETRSNLKEVVERIENKINAHYEYADELANRYSNLYYAGFWWNYLVSGFAVMSAFLIFVSEIYRPAFVEIFAVAEFLALASIMLVYFLDKKGRWYDRRIDYRLLAEMIRQTHFLATLGRIPPILAPQAIHTHYGDPSGSWVHWHYLTVVKQIGLPRTKLTSEYLRAVARLIKFETNEQAEYHEGKSAENFKINHWLHVSAVSMFFIVALACIFHLFFEKIVLIPHFGHTLHLHENAVKALLSFFAIVSPALGAAFAGIRSQGEYERIARHSAAMADYLREKSEQLNTLEHETNLNSSSLAKVVEDIAEKRIEEVLDWRIVFHKRPIELA